MRLTVVNVLAAVAVLFGVGLGVSDMRHTALCARTAVTILDGYEHHTSSATLDKLVLDFQAAC